MSPENYQNILENMHDGIMTVKSGGKISYGNQNAQKILGSQIEENMPLSALLDNKVNDDFMQTVIDALSDQGQSKKRIVDYAAPGSETIRKLDLTVTSLTENGEKNVIAVFSDITEEERNKKQKKDSLILLSVMVFALSIVNYLYALYVPLFSPEMLKKVLTYSVLGIAFVISVYVMLRSSLTLKDIGIVSNNSAKVYISSLIVSVGIFAAIMGIKYVLTLFNVITPDASHPFIGFKQAAAAGYFCSTYPLEILLQEFAARSIMQSSLLRIYSGKYSAFTSIFVSSVFFGALHFEFGFLYMCGAALLMGLFGIYYNKTRNIFATSIIHYAFTTSAMILGFIQ